MGIIKKIEVKDLGLFKNKDNLQWTAEERKKYKKMYNFSGMTDEDRYAIFLRDQIIKNRDVDELFQLEEEDFSIALYEILCNQCDYDPAKLSYPQKIIFLCMQLENFGQADTTLTFLQEEYPLYCDEVVKALHEIGATKSAEIIKQIIELLPKDGSWFYDKADENIEKEFEKLNSEFASYPEGRLSNLYRKYAEKHKRDFLFASPV